MLGNGEKETDDPQESLTSPPLTLSPMIQASSPVYPQYQSQITQSSFRLPGINSFNTQQEMNRSYSNMLSSNTITNVHKTNTFCK